MTEQNDSLRAECQNAEARYRGIIDSTSWKITRPARVLIRLIRPDGYLMIPLSKSRRTISHVAPKWLLPPPGLFRSG